MTQYRIFSRLRQKAGLPGRFRWLGLSSLWAYRILTWSVLVAGLVFAGMVVALRYWVLPHIESYRDDIARIASERAGQRITIGRIHANWDGLRPQLVMEQVTVFDAAGRPALEFARIDNTVSWMSLPSLEPRFHAVDIYQPTLNIRRDARGVISVGGVELAGAEGGGGFADWLLRHGDIEVHDATIVWTDEQRAAPQLELKNVSFHMLNSGKRHRFGLRATPPGELAAPLDLRGDVTGRSLRELTDWNGRLFVQLDYVDIAAWRTWIPFPVHLPRGAGALRAWLAFDHNRLVEIVADVRMANVLTRLADDLPELDLAELRGRVGWKQSERGFEISTSRLGLTTTGGLTLPPADFLLRVDAGDKRRLAHGELQASVIELGPLVSLAEHLPLGRQVRKQLAEFSPKGSLTGVALRWTGDWSEPQEYTIRGRFQNVALNRVGKIPGFTGVSGTIEASERGGALLLSSRKASVEMPLVFRDVHEFDALLAQVKWARSGGETELRLSNVSFSNAHLAGSLQGVYRTAGATRGYIDLTSRLTRAEARFVGRYVPLMVAASEREWANAAFPAGRVTEATLRVRGNLDRFPFADSRDGVFQATVRVAGGKLHYGDDWPDIENILAEVVFRGKRLDVYGRQGTVFGARISKFHVEIPDLTANEEVMNIRGEAEGPTGEFFAFIEKSPVFGMIDQFTEGWKVQGGGRLALRIEMPMRAKHNTKAAGTYQFANNTVAVHPDLPAVERADGSVEFTNSGVRAQNVKGIVLGGPVSITALTARDATVQVNVQGRINADIARRGPGPSWVQRLRGATDWRAQINARSRSADVVVESSLLGLAADLPAPLVKAAAESLPVRFERRTLADKRDRISFSAGDVVSMILLRSTDGQDVTITRGVVRFGGAVSEPARDGLWISGTVKALDVDRWVDLLKPGGGQTRVESGGVDLRLGAVDLLGRRFGELGVSGIVQGGEWSINLSGNELDGIVTWQPQGAGKFVARMNTLAIPAAETPGAAGRGDPQARRDPETLPALDIVAEQFFNADRLLGRLELAAAPEGRDWRIEQLRLTSPETTVALDGVWQLGLPQPRTQVNVRLETSDIGKLLTRLGYPEGVRGGTSKLGGSLSWTGAPYEMDYATLTGGLELQAAKGQFVKLDPGIGKLLGVMNLQALPRRVTLDFRDVFSEGFAFDEVAGAARINSGTAATESFRIRGPAAHIIMRGQVDLVRETQNVSVRITPQVIESVSVAGALVGGPVAGVATYLAQKVLKDPFGRIVSFEYDVAGTWSEPTVKRVARLTPPSMGAPATGFE